MNDSRCVILSIHSFNRITDNRLSQIAFNISLSDALIDGILKTTIRNMYFLPDFNKNNSHTRILTNWDHIFPCNRQIFAQLLQNLTSERRFFLLHTFVKCRLHVI